MGAPQAPPQQPVSVGAEANPPAGSAGGPRWQTAALWIGAVIASTTIAYFVTKGLRANDDRMAKNRAERNGDETPAPVGPTEPKFVLPNDGSITEALSAMKVENGRLTERLQDTEHWIRTQEKRGALRDVA